MFEFEIISVPPEEAVYQLIWYPIAGKSTVNAGVASPTQMVGLFGLVGGVIGGQVQFGAVMFKVLMQPRLSAVMMMSVPAGIPVMVFSAIVPAVVVTTPEVEVKTTS